METVVLRALVHEGRERIGIYFPNFGSLNKLLLKIEGVRWSRTLKCWHCSFSREKYEAIISVFKGKALVDISELADYVKARKAGNSGTKIDVQSPTTTPPQKNPHAINPIKKSIPLRIQPINLGVLKKLKQELILKGYSASTARTYLNEVSAFLQIIGDNNADEFTPQRVRDYLQYCFEKLKLSENTLHSRINALKFYYEQVLGRDKFFWEIPRPQKQQNLPKFFNQDEVAAIIKAVGNQKQQAMLMLAYSAGLRVSEVVSLKTRNIDSSRMCILIEQAKGKKDRIVPLSPLLLVVLREYFKTMRPPVDGYLFPGQNLGEHYSTRSLQSVINAAKKKAGILKKGSIHSLRHSFATHLLDRGTDVTMIMKLLGHNDLKTTLRYLHTTNRDIMNIVSPLDHLGLNSSDDLRKSNLR